MSFRSAALSLTLTYLDDAHGVTLGMPHHGRLCPEVWAATGGRDVGSFQFTSIDNHVVALCWVCLCFRLSHILLFCGHLRGSSSTFVGALAQAFTSDRFGRRGSILIWSGIFTIGTAIQTSTVHSIAQITIGRFIAGLGVGALSGTCDDFYSGRSPSYSLTTSQLLFPFTMARLHRRRCVVCCSCFTSCRLSSGSFVPPAVTVSRHRLHLRLQHLS